MSLVVSYIPGETLTSSNVTRLSFFLRVFLAFGFTSTFSSGSEAASLFSSSAAFLLFMALFRGVVRFRLSL